MKYILYKAVSPSKRTYVGVTNNFKRRMKEHMSSPYPFGHALRKYGKDNFEYSFESFDTRDECLQREADLIGREEVESRKYYNSCLGGILSNVLAKDNPMHRKDVLEKHPGLFTSEENPMYDPESKRRMIESQNRKKVYIEGIEYEGVRAAARQLNSYRQFVIHRLKSKNFPDWYYL